MPITGRILKEREKAMNLDPLPVNDRSSGTETSTNSRNLGGPSANVSVIPSPSSIKLPSLEEGTSQSMTLIDDSAKTLFGLMEDIKKKTDRDGGDVMTACEIAKQIASLARVKLDFIKLMKGSGK